MKDSIKKTIGAAAAGALILGTGIGLYEHYSSTSSKTPTFKASGIDWTAYVLDIPTLGIPDVDVPELDMPDVDAPNIEYKEMIAGSNESSIVEKFDDEVDAIEKISDKKMTVSGSENYFKNGELGKWISIYKQHSSSTPVSYVSIDKPFKMITEVCIPMTQAELATLDTNLQYYKSEGYDSVLVTFTPDDKKDDILNTVKYIIKNHDMKVWLAYSGLTSRRVSPFMDPAKLKDILESVAPYLSGYLNSWRRTSAHFWKQDRQFMNFVNRTLRIANPKIPIIGELYNGSFWNNATEETSGLVTNIFKNASGVLVMNFGFASYDIKIATEKMIKPRTKNLKLVGCVVGYESEYLLDENNKNTYQENMADKHAIEKDFLDNGYIGTITFSDDGSSLITNDLTKTLYSKLGK